MKYALLLYADDLVECGSMDEALAFAARISEARIGGVEVRQLLDFEALGAEAAG